MNNRRLRLRELRELRERRRAKIKEKEQENTIIPNKCEYVKNHDLFKEKCNTYVYGDEKICVFHKKLMKNIKRYQKLKKKKNRRVKKNGNTKQS